MSARETVLGAVRAALGADPVVPKVPRAYRGAGAAVTTDFVALFCERVADYRATVTPVSDETLEAALAEACTRRGSRRVVAAPGIAWRIDGVQLERDRARTAPGVLDRVDAALTGCALAIAETGTIVLDGGPGSGRRALTLVPDHHLCVVRADQVVFGLPDAIEMLGDAVRAGRPVTFISGPSATSDIELERVEGVHGPRQLDVFVVGG